MAITRRCPACGTQASWQNDTCPKCSVDLNKPPPGGWRPPIAPLPSDVPRVVVADFDVSFGSLVWLLIKLSIAAIPAAIVLAIVWSLVAGLLLGIAR